MSSHSAPKSSFFNLAIKNVNFWRKKADQASALSTHVMTAHSFFGVRGTLAATFQRMPIKRPAVMPSVCSCAGPNLYS
jgi:hypothetical protein